MQTARPWAVTNLSRLADGSYQFTAVILKSTGLTYIRGCRYMAQKAKKNIYMPSVRVGAHWYQVIKNSRNDLACLRKLLNLAIAEYESNERVRESSQAASDRIEDGPEAVDLQPES